VPFERAEGRRTWSFPRDHGQHPRYRLEWWYYTGIVRTGSGRAFGYQATFFRQGVNPAPDRRGSAWRVGSLYLAHLAVSDIERGRFSHAAQTGRDSLGISGAARDRQQVWLNGWRADPLAGNRDGVRLNAQNEDLGIALELAAERPPVLHGNGGLDRKGVAPGQASWYYSLTRLRTKGTLRVGTESWEVAGTSWMDHEFGTSQLGADEVGWDWFALRLDSGADLMLYRLRTAAGGVSPTSGGTLVEADGRITRLRLAADAGRAAEAAQGAEGTASAAPRRYWTSAATQAKYPLGWTLRVPRLGLELDVEPASEAQELVPGAGLPFGYWEGAVWVRGHQAGRPVRGEGYLELTGYAGDLRGSFR
jgi:predicted secreted hydrolase